MNFYLAFHQEVFVAVRKAADCPLLIACEMPHNKTIALSKKHVHSGMME